RHPVSWTRSGPFLRRVRRTCLPPSVPPPLRRSQSCRSHSSRAAPFSELGLDLADSRKDPKACHASKKQVHPDRNILSCDQKVKVSGNKAEGCAKSWQHSRPAPAQVADQPCYGKGEKWDRAHVYAPKHNGV